MQRLELIEGATAKFWQYEVRNNELVVEYGRIETKGQSNVKSFDTPSAAEAAAAKLVREKLAKGYALANGARELTAAVAPATSAINGSQPAETKSNAFEALVTKLLAVKFKKYSGGVGFDPKRITKLLPGDDDIAKAAAASDLLVGFPSLIAHWPFLEGLAGLQAPLTRQAAKTLVMEINTERMWANSSPELAPGWHSCLHNLVLRAFAGTASELRVVLVSKRNRGGLIITRSFAGDELTAEERTFAKSKLGVSGVPGSGTHPSSVLVWSVEKGIHELPWKAARKSYGWLS